MGQRSQIYVRITNKKGEKNLIAKYFQWNYAERMISRAKYGIEYLQSQKEYLDLDSVKEQVDNILNVNFDMIDYLHTTDIIQEYLTYGQKWEENFKDFVFYRQDNNDGKLFIDIDKNGKIKYCLTDWELKIFKNAKAYMDWDYEDWLDSKYLNEEQRQKCIKNIQWLDENVEVMTEEELEDFINDDYTYAIEEKKKWIENQILYLKGGK